MSDSGKNEKNRTALQAVFDLLKQDECDVFFGFAVGAGGNSLKFLPKSASAQKWFCDIYAEALVEEILKFHAPAHLPHRCSDFLNGVNVCYSNSDAANYFEPIRNSLENNFDRYLQQQTEHLTYLLHRGLAIRKAVPVRDPLKTLSRNEVDRWMAQNRGDHPRRHAALMKLTQRLLEGDGLELFLEDFPEQAKFCRPEGCRENPGWILELLARILVLELMPRPERMRSKLPKGAVAGSQSFKFLMKKMKQVAEAESCDELWTLSHHIGYTVARGSDISEAEKDALDQSAQDHSLAMCIAGNRRMNTVKDSIFLGIRAGILETGDVDRCWERVNDLLDQMMTQGEGGKSHE